MRRTGLTLLAVGVVSLLAVFAMSRARSDSAQAFVVSTPLRVGLVDADDVHEFIYALLGRSKGQPVIALLSFWFPELQREDTVAVFAVDQSTFCPCEPPTRVPCVDT